MAHSVGIWLLCSLSGLIGDEPPGEPVHQAVAWAEAEMARRPGEALLIARSAAGRLSGRADLVKRLFGRAARVQEDQLASLSENQVVELAGLHDTMLGDRPAGERVRRKWLKLRQDVLDPDDGAGHVQLARLWLGWLADREAAATLCVRALQRTPALPAAAKILRDELRYELTETGWAPRELVHQGGHPVRPAPGEDREVRVGMTVPQVQKLRGWPDRVSRQILFGRYLEQWLYGRGSQLVVHFEYVKGLEPHVVSVRQTNVEKP